eukprot:gene24885-biopygen2953
MPAPRPRHARATPAPPQAKKILQPAPRPRHANATPAPLSCSPRNGFSQPVGKKINDINGLNNWLNNSQLRGANDVMNEKACNRKMGTGAQSAPGNVHEDYA